MNVSEIMTKNPTCCFDTTSLRDAAQMMAMHDCGCIPVIDDDENKRPIGTITDRDITIRSLANGKDPMNMVVGDIMTTRPTTIGEGASFDECFRTMEKNQIRRLLVVNNKGECIGIVAQADIARKAGEHETAELVKEVSIGRAGSAAG